MAPGARRSISRTSAHSEIGSVPNPSMQSVDGSNSAASASSRKVRGKAKNQALTDYIKATGQKPRIEIPLDLARPIGKWSKEFISEVGIICRTYAPLICHNWKLVKKQQRKIFQERIRGRFDIDLHVPHVEKAVNTYLGERFKDFRCRLHKYYKKLEGDHQDRRRQPYDEVSQEDWNVICDRFQTEEFKKVSEKNSANRQKLLVNHCVGSKAFVRYREELRDAETLQELGRIEIYKKTHYAESEFGSHWTSPLAEQNYEAMKKLQSQSVQDGPDPMPEDDICDEILGIRPGYIRGLGHGMVPLSSSSSSVNSEITELTKRAEEAEKLNEELKECVLDQDQKIEEMKATQERKMEEMLANMEGMGAKLEAFISKFGFGRDSSSWSASRE